MRKIILILMGIMIFGFVAVGVLTKRSVEPSKLSKLRDHFTETHVPSVDHSKFKILQQEFTLPEKVTEACITCHNKTAVEVMHSNHWSWEREEYVEGKGIAKLGKKNALNNFCIGVQGNEQSCAKCHVGFGMTKADFNFDESQNEIDCLVCHDNTETYVKGSEMAGAPSPTVDLSKIAQNVGLPDRSNCGVCHFFGGGGNNVKHGDLDMAMFNPTREIDVHMDASGMDMKCTECHSTKNHQMEGKLYSLSSMNQNRVGCEKCHSETPHENDILNEHNLKVACQTCHIPVYAKENATKLTWDWSTAGKLKNGEPYHEDDENGNHTYLSIKGSFTWGQNLKPEYVWFNGKASHYFLGDEIQDTSDAVEINILNGSYSDRNSKIIPVKIHRAYQPYDPVNKMLIQPKLYASEKGEGAFWKDFNWDKAAETGMKELNLPYSGKLDFIETKMYWPINHQISPKEQAVSCNECHSRDNSRLAGLNDFYMPGRDYSKIVDIFGKLIIILTLFGVMIHGTVRIYSAYNSKRRG